MKRLTNTMAVIALSAAAMTASGKVTPSTLVSDNMVLQQQTEARLWGKAKANSTVTATPEWDGKTYTTTSDAEGNWLIAIPTPAASYTPWSITLSDGEDLRIGNVLIGEVWLASGQSNMQMPLKGFGGCNILGGDEEIATSASRADKIRFFNVPLTQSYEPQEGTDGRWDVPSPDTAPEFSATAWYYAKRLNDVLDVPIGIMNAAYGGARVESWTPRDILETYADVSLDPKDIESMTGYLRPMLMYNAMFVPVKNYTYKGIIWYQGCSNVGAYQTYADRLVTMVERWRDEIGLGDIPFYAVEIAPYQYDAPGEPGNSPHLREAQWEAVSRLSNAGMISTNNLMEPYERYNIHPGNKAGVGRRLGDLALNKTYGKTQFYTQSPRYKGHRVVDDAIWVAIDSPDGGICRNYDIEGFEIAGDDRKFYPADSVWVEWRTNEVVVSSRQVPHPVAVRYCYNDFQIGTMYGGNYLPLILFRTDDWDD